MPTDDELVAATLHGDPEAFGALVGRYSRLVTALTWRYHGRADAAIDADDVIQQIWLRAYSRLVIYRPSGTFAAWLGAITVNTCRSLARRRHLATIDVALLAPRPGREPGPEALAIRRETGDRLADALALLSPRQREAVLLCEVVGYSQADAGSMLGVAARTIKHRTFHGRARLRGLLAAD